MKKKFKFKPKVLSFSEQLLKARAKELIHLTSYKILAIDLSYRSAGLCEFHVDDSIQYQTWCYTNPEMGSVGFQTLRKVSENAGMMIDWIKKLVNPYKYDIVIVEMPCFSQSAKSAIIIGILWGIISQLDCVVVEPSLLKRWSGSKSGDKKEKVKEKVLERIHVPKNIESNDDIMDAIGLAFTFNDMIRQQKYVSTNS